MNTVKDLKVGTIGIDHSGLNYADREYRVLSINGRYEESYYPTELQELDQITLQYVDNGKIVQQQLKFKLRIHNDIIALRNAEIRKIPGWLAEDKIEYDVEGNTAWFLGWLAGAGQIIINSDSPEKNTTACENKYHDLTDQVVEWHKPPINSTAEADRYGARALISFLPTDRVPDQLASLITSVGKRMMINRMGLFWALVKIGFLLGKIQNSNRIRLAIPNSQQVFFDNGLVGNNLSALLLKSLAFNAGV